MNIVTGGQRIDGAMLAEVLADICVPRPRIRPDGAICDKTYSSKVDRDLLR